MIYTELLKPYTPPPSEFAIVLPLSGRSVTVRTRKLPRAPWYLYSCFALPQEQPFLELLSRPSVHDIATAMSRSAILSGGKL